MSFCEKCGKQLAQGEVCRCQVAAKKKFNPVIIVIAVLAIAILAVVIVLNINQDGGSSKDKKDDKEKKISYTDPIDNYLKIVNKRNADSVAKDESMMPEFSVKKYHAIMDILAESEEYSDEIEDMDDYLEDCYEDCEDEFEGWKISFEEKRAKELDEEDISEYQETVEEYYEDELSYMVENLEEYLEDEDYIEDVVDMLEISERDARKLVEATIDYYKSYEELKVTAGYEVTGNFVLKAGDETYETEYMEFLILKINGSWVYCELIDYDSLGFEEDDEEVFSFFFSEIRRSHFKAKNIF